ncbi:MAG: PIG-L family deacetylase [Polyangiales bacterium]
MSAHEGTSEADWITHTALPNLPTWQLPEAGRVVLFSPHPDDETLGAGGTLRLLVRAGIAVEVIAVSDGEAAYPEADGPARRVLGDLRQTEQRSALAALGVTDSQCHWWHLPDGGLSGVPDLADRMLTVLRGAAYCLAPFRDDGHPDHDAVGRAAACACATAGVRLGEYPIWAWHWRRPDAFAALWARGRRILLDDEARQRKHQALCQYVTQTEGYARWGLERPVLPAAVLAHFSRSFETLLV